MGFLAAIADSSVHAFVVDKLDLKPHVTWPHLSVVSVSGFSLGATWALKVH